MTWPKMVRCTLVLFALMAMVGSVSAADDSIVKQASGNAPAAPGNSDDLTAILREQAHNYEAAFARGDAESLANMWTTSGIYCDANGKVYAGRQNIEAMFKKYFQDFGAAPMTIEIQSVRSLGANSAIERGVASLKDSSGKVVSSAPYSVIHVKVNDTWQIASCNEAPPNAVPNEQEALRDLEWLVGDWTARGSLGEATLSTRWEADHHCLLGKFKIKSANEQHDDLMVIGYDPRTRSIASWVFASDGGTGHGRWQKNGKRWLVQMTAMTLDGHAARAVNVFEPGDDGTFVWQSTNRTLDGTVIPDSEKITAHKLSASAD